MKKYFFLLFLTFVGAISLSAQTGQWGLGPHLFISLPQTGFENYTKDGEGIGVKAYYRFHNNYLSLRADLAYISYGERRESEWVDQYYYLITRRNESIQLTMGPQWTLRLGPVTPYLALMGGWYHYHAVVTVEDYVYGYPYSETTGSQNKWGWNLSGGALIDLGLGPYIDIGVKYQTIFDAESFVDNVKIKQDAKDFCITLGVVFFVN